MKSLTFKEAMEYAFEHGIKEEKMDYSEGSIILILNNGHKLICESQYDGPLSDVTPGDGLQPPEFKLDTSKLENE